MPGNIEVKAEIADFNETIQLALGIANEHIPLEQCDTFFDVKNDCRLKLRYEKQRNTGKENACLIAYQRPDTTGPKFSNYILSPVSDVETMTAALAMSNGIQGRVKKSRDAFIVNRNDMKARVHVDKVTGLGIFIEFEVIVEHDSQMDDAREFAAYLCQHFGVAERDHIPGAYWNLIQAKGAGAAANV